jgi:hypothetical protein
MLPEKIAVVWITNADWLPDTDAVTHAASKPKLVVQNHAMTNDVELRRSERA